MLRSISAAVHGMPRLVLPALALALLAQPALAQTAPAPNQAQMDARKAELRAAWQDVARVGQAGPRKIELLDQASFNLPAGQIFVPADTANRVMAALGNRRLDTRVGLVLPVDAKQG